MDAAHLFDMNTGGFLASIRTAEHSPIGAAFSSDGKLFVTAGRGDSRPRQPPQEPFSIHVWDIDAVLAGARKASTDTGTSR
jgi:hypothetical protein